MPAPSKPSKQQVRQWFQDRQKEHKPPPSIEEIRRQLGWGLQVKTRDDGRGR